LREPDRAKTSSNKIFGEYYYWIFDESILSSENIVCLWKIYKFIDEDRRRAMSAMNSKTSKTYEESWLIEGVFHLLYMLSCKCDADGTNIFEYNAVVKHYEVVKTEVDEFMAQNPGQAAYRVFRSAITKRLLTQFARSRQLALDLGDAQ
ncbi:MAG: hypothetical protein ABL918_13000, partial [Chakrabartia sp.]